MKINYLIIALLLSLASVAQVTKVNLKASGLTCSMCSNAINKALKTLDFVEKVDADIKTYSFDISFKPNSKVDFDKIKKKVEDAGFSVSGFTAYINFNHVQVNENIPVSIDDKGLLFINLKEHSLTGVKMVKVLNKGFVSPKEQKKVVQPRPSSGIYYVTI